MSYEWAETMRETVDDSDNGKALAMHIVPRHSVVGLVLRKGRMDCRSAAHAKGICHKALKMGMPIDYAQGLDGTWVVYLSHKGTDYIRQKHGIKERKVRTNGSSIPSLQESIDRLTDLTGLDRGIVIDMLKANNCSRNDANEIVKAYCRMKKEEGVQ